MLNDDSLGEYPCDRRGGNKTYPGSTYGTATPSETEGVSM